MEVTDDSKRWYRCGVQLSKQYTADEPGSGPGGGAQGQVSISLGTHSSVYSSKRGNCHTIIWLHISGDKIVTYFFIYFLSLNLNIFYICKYFSDRPALGLSGINILYDLGNKSFLEPSNVSMWL